MINSLQRQGVSPAAKPEPCPTVLRLPAVAARTGLSASTIRRGVNAGSFPRPVPLGKRALGWLSAEITAWIAGRAAARTGVRS